MNANEISPKANARLSRIKKISRVLKILFLLYIPLYFALGGNLPFVRGMPDGFGIVWGTYATFSDAPLIAKLIVGVGTVLILAAITTCYQLSNLYEKGIIFSARNVRLLGRIGYLAFSYGLLKVWGPVLISTWYSWIGASGSSLNSAFSALLGIHEFLSSPWIIGGLFVVVIAHIMDEGRKIQEEQELTV
jgi:hypothetical protein